MKSEICGWCGNYGPPIEIHGHTQCSFCHANIDPCCSGETACKEDIKQEKKNGDLNDKK